MFCLLALSVVAISQNIDPAIAKYAENGKLISVANLSGLKECSIRTVVGKVVGVKLEGNRSQLSLRTKKEEAVNFEILLDRLLDDDRKALVSDLLKKKMPLRVAGYACDQDAALTVLSIYRVY